MGDVARFVIKGVNPVPWKAPMIAVIKVRGRSVPKVYKPAEVVAYQKAIKAELAQWYSEFQMVDYENLSLKFYFWRNAGTKNDHVADATNLQKALEDALQDVIFANDRAVTHIESWIVEQGPEVSPLIVMDVAEAIEQPPVDVAELVGQITQSTTPDKEEWNVSEIF